MDSEAVGKVTLVLNVLKERSAVAAPLLDIIVLSGLSFSKEYKQMLIL